MVIFEPERNVLLQHTEESLLRFVDERLHLNIIFHCVEL